jgi:hypothetical protein
VFKKIEIGKNNGTLPKLASKQKCVQDNSGIFADERENVNGSQRAAETRIKTIVA